MKKLKIFLSVLVLMATGTIFGQQDPQYTQYMYNMNILNPAYAGSKGVGSIGILGRTQWVGLEESPQTFTVSAHTPFGKNLGIGVSFIHDEIGPAKEDNAYLDLSYTIITSQEGRLAFGLKGGFTFLDVRSLVLGSATPDPLNVPVNEVTPNFGAGIYYYTDKFYLGASAPNFLETRHLDKGTTVSTASERAHYFLTSGYVFDLSDNLKFKPSTLLKGVSGAPLSVDISGNFLINEKFEIGLSHRLDDSVSGLLGFQVNKNFRIGYAYDHTVTDFGKYNDGSHEIMLLFDFTKRALNSPRFF